MNCTALNSNQIETTPNNHPRLAVPTAATRPSVGVPVSNASSSSGIFFHHTNNLLDVPRPNNSEEENSPTELNNCRRITEKPPLVSMLRNSSLTTSAIYCFSDPKPTGQTPNHGHPPDSRRQSTASSQFVPLELVQLVPNDLRRIRQRRHLQRSSGGERSVQQIRRFLPTDAGDAGNRGRITPLQPQHSPVSPGGPNRSVHPTAERLPQLEGAARTEGSSLVPGRDSEGNFPGGPLPAESGSISGAPEHHQTRLFRSVPQSTTTSTKSSALSNFKDDTRL